jgi:hypothetical protein
MRRDPGFFGRRSALGRKGDATAHWAHHSSPAPRRVYAEPQSGHDSIAAYQGSKSAVAKG